jgi:class 3 adenylate cyclase
MIEARAVHSFLENSAIKILPRWQVFALSLAIFAALTAIFALAAPALSAAAMFASLALFALSGGYLLAERVLAPSLPWALGAVALFLGVNLYRVVTENRARRWVTHAFRHYLSPSLVRQLAEHPESLKLGGERRRVAVMFADLSGFTAFSESLAGEPERIVEHLNAFFEIVAQTIGAHGGYIDKFIGDAVMGVWGAPVAVENPEIEAAQAARACLKAIEARNAELAAAGAPQRFTVRIGLSAGEAVAGNLGARDRFNYTVIGDAVNRAARLQAACKEHGRLSLADEEIVSRLGPEIPAQFIAEGNLRGFSTPVRQYSLDPD